MKVPMKSILVIVLSIALLLTFTACSSGTSTATASASTEASTEASAEASAVESSETSSAETTQVAEPEIVIEVAHMFAEGDPNTIAIEEGKAHIEELSGGRITFTIYPNGTYGEQFNSIQAVQMGTLDVMCSGFGSDYYAPAGAIQGPFLFESYDQWNRFTESDYCDQLCAKIEEAAGYHIMGVGHFGFRELLSTVEATTVEDLSKLKMRVVNVEPYPQAAVVLGPTGTPIGIVDVYMSLQTGVVDATENPVSQLVSMKFYEVAKYLEMTDHMLATEYWICSNNCYDSLSAEDQAIFDETFDWIADRIEELVEENIAANIQVMVDNGVTVIENIDKQQFMDRLDLVFDTYPDWEEIYEAVQGL